MLSLASSHQTRTKPNSIAAHLGPTRGGGGGAASASPPEAAACQGPCEAEGEGGARPPAGAVACLGAVP